jgi:hypothetical protein
MNITDFVILSFSSLIDGVNYTYPGICIMQSAIIKLCILTYSDEAKLQRKEKKTKSTDKGGQINFSVFSHGPNTTFLIPDS